MSLGSQRNEPCHCGSQKEYKRCCYNWDVADQNKYIPRKPIDIRNKYAGNYQKATRPAD